jgi:hypothetical protein
MKRLIKNYNMAGKPAIKIFQYSNEGKYIKTFNSISEIHREYFNDSKYPFFVGVQNILEKLPDNTIICKERLGRDKIKAILRRLSNPFILKDDRSNSNEIEVLNVDKIVIATFFNISMASKLLNISANSIHAIMKSSMNGYPKNKYGVYFRYKEKL